MSIEASACSSRMISEHEAGKVLEIVRDVIASDHAVAAHRALVQRWEAQEQTHLHKIAQLTERERHLQDRINAQRYLHDELKKDVDELRMTLAAQLAAKNVNVLTEQLGDVAQYIRAAKLLIQPGRKLTIDTLQALGLPPPAGRGRRPSEHYARSIATLVLPALGFEILEARGAHPDLICTYEGRTLGVEVEVGLNDYDSHGHDAADAHVVACWTPPTGHQLQDGYFRARNVTKGFSDLLSVVTLQTPMIHSNPFGVGSKKFRHEAVTS